MAAELLKTQKYGDRIGDYTKRRPRTRGFWIRLATATLGSFFEIFVSFFHTLVESQNPQTMDPESAAEFVKQGITLLLLDVPQFTLIGIDTQVRPFSFL